MACILLWSSAVRVHDSQAYRNSKQYLLSALVRAGSPSRGGDVTVYVLNINQPSLPIPFYSVLVSIYVFMAFSNCISSHKFSRQLSAFSLCSSGLISALLVLSTIKSFYESLLQPLYNPFWLTGLKAPTN